MSDSLVTHVIRELDEIRRNQQAVIETVEKLPELDKESVKDLEEKVDKLPELVEELVKKLMKDHDEKVEKLTEFFKESMKRFDTHELLLRRLIDQIPCSEQRKEPEPSKIDPKTDQREPRNDHPPEKRARRDSTPDRSSSRRQDITCPFCPRHRHDAAKCFKFPDGLTRQHEMLQRKLCTKCAEPDSHRFCPNETKKCDFCPEYHLYALCPVAFPRKEAKVQARQGRNRAVASYSQNSERRQQSRSRHSKSRAPRSQTPSRVSSDQLNTGIPQKSLCFKKERLAELSEFLQNDWQSFSNYPSPSQPTNILTTQSCSTENQGRGYFDVPDEPMQVKEEEPDSFLQ